MCEGSGKFVKFERSAPDLVFAQLPVLSDITTLTTLGKGAFGLVNLGASLFSQPPAFVALSRYSRRPEG